MQFDIELNYPNLSVIDKYLRPTFNNLNAVRSG